MTVAELIRILQTHPKDMRVVVDGYEEGYDDLEQDLISVKEIRLDVGNKWWEGHHRDSWDDRVEGSGIVKALLLQTPLERRLSMDLNARAASGADEEQNHCLWSMLIRLNGRPIWWTSAQTTPGFRQVLSGANFYLKWLCFKC